MRPENAELECEETKRGVENALRNTTNKNLKSSMHLEQHTYAELTGVIVMIVEGTLNSAVHSRGHARTNKWSHTPSGDNLPLSGTPGAKRSSSPLYWRVQSRPGKQ